MTQKTLLYLRTDICNEKLTAGGSVAHTIGVIKGFQDVGYVVICASSCMHSVLRKIKNLKIISLSNPQFFAPLRWKINSFLSTFFFAKIIVIELKKKDVEFIYQRYSLLNATGLLLAWWYKKKLILEYNGSEYWIACHWVQKKRWIKFEWFMKAIEDLNITRADMLVVVSEVLKNELVARGVKKERILVNPNGVDTNIFRPGVREVEHANNNYHLKKNLERRLL